MKIDVFPHILPRRFFDRMLEIAGGNLYMQKRMRAIPVLVDLEERFRIMDRYEGYVQVLTLASPPIEALARAERSGAHTSGLQPVRLAYAVFCLLQTTRPTA